MFQLTNRKTLSVGPLVSAGNEVSRWTEADNVIRWRLRHVVSNQFVFSHGLKVNFISR